MSKLYATTAENAELIEINLFILPNTFIQKLLCPADFTLPRCHYHIHTRLIDAICSSLRHPIHPGLHLCINNIRSLLFPPCFSSSLK